jgi:hypothetical protein
MNSVFFSKHEHLGEVIDSLILIENLGLTQNKKIKVLGSSVVEEILELFEFEKINFTKSLTGEKNSILRNAAAQIIWNEYKKNQNKICLPKSRLTFKKNNITIVQMDSRSANNQICNEGDRKKPLSKGEMKIAIKKWAIEPWFAAGGVDTVDYLGLGKEKYKLGNIKFLTQTIGDCFLFVGACSGLAHLAGLLGTKSKVITLFGHKGFSVFYKRMFHSVECFSRNELKPKIL